MKLKIICFDIDNVICKTNNTKNYSKSVPIKKNIKVINEAYNNGFNIILYTARYMGRCNGNVSKVKKHIKSFTIKQLKNGELSTIKFILENQVLIYLLMINLYFLKKKTGQNY